MTKVFAVGKCIHGRVIFTKIQHEGLITHANTKNLRAAE